MALNSLTLSVTSGVVGRRFKSAVSGMTAGNVVEVIDGSSQGFGYVNGFVTSPALSYDVNVVVLRERNPNTGETLTTRVLVTGVTQAAARALAVPVAGAALTSYRLEPVTSNDGSLIYYAYADDVTGALKSVSVGTPVLGTLTLSPGAASLAVDTPTSGTILGATNGSTIVAANMPIGFTINSAARTWSYDGTGAPIAYLPTLTETLAGATGSPKVNAITSFRTFDYWVDSNGGGSAGTYASPFLTLGAALAAAGSGSNKGIGVKAGHVSRETSLTSAAPGLIVACPTVAPAAFAGPGAVAAAATLPRILGSAALTGPFTLVSGTKYTVPLAAAPTTLAIVSPAGAITKLYQDADANVTSGEWSWSGGTLTFDAGVNPSGYTLEVPAAGGLSAFQHGAANQVLQGLRFEFSGGSAILTGSFSGSKWLNVWGSYTGNDGFDVSQAYDAVMYGGGSLYPGISLNAGNGPGDGFSAHQQCNYKIRGATFIGGTQTGLGNLADAVGSCLYSYFEDNNVNCNIYNNTVGDFGGSHEIAYNLFVNKKTTSRQTVNSTNTNSTTMVLKFYNNTIYVVAPANASFLCTFNGPASGTGYGDFSNNAVHLIGSKTAVFARLSGTAYSSNNVTYATGGGTSTWYSSGLPNTAANDLSANPLLTDPANGDYSLQAGSPAIASGKSLGYTRDFLASLVPATPDRGALQRVA